MSKFLPQSIFISGGNRGLGYQLVQQILAKWKPKHVFTTFRNVAQAKELHELAKANDGVLHLFQMDMREDSQFPKIAASIDAITGGSGLNLLINNAGVTSRYARLGSTKKEALIETFEVNTVGPILLTKELVPLLEKASSNSSMTEDSIIGIHRAAVINMSSILGSISANDNGGMYPYRCSKAALNAATRSMYFDFKKSHILAVALHPGWVQTDMGGPKAPLTPETSVAGILKVLETLDSSHNGGFYSYDGTKIEW